MATTNKRRYSRWVLLGILMSVVVIWAVSGLMIYRLGNDWGERGTMGDMFGAVNALFSGLAFAGLLFTIFLQKEELEIQRGELELNRDELIKTADAQYRTQEALVEQVAQMHLTAKLNAMNTIINYYNALIANPSTPLELIETAKQKRRKIIQQIDELIDGIQDAEIE